MVAPSIWGAAGARGAGRAAWGGSRPGGVGRWVGCRTEDQDGAQHWLHSPPSLPPCLPASSCRLPSTHPQVAPPHSLPIKVTFCCPTRARSLPETLCTFLPVRRLHKEQPSPFTKGSFPEAGGGAGGFSLLSGRESRISSATELLGNSGKFLNLPGPQFPPLQNGNNHGYSTYPMGLLGESG